VMAGEGPQRAVDRRQLAVELVQHPQVELEGLATRRGACGRMETRLGDRNPTIYSTSSDSSTQGTCAQQSRIG
jgi:hypothetical protein